MNGKIRKCKFSEDNILDMAIESVQKGSTYEDVQSKFNLSDDDIELIDFVINEF
ncbi:Panacea domain-containing protein [Cerasibacillus terrae]|uniref:hypothetical protein n=1 Tax=Cerasibacillus terrae TaxID=2498845 RepID=UPI001745DE8A|nr:hypothetical protein [Cerasibacillus terrae]